MKFIIKILFHLFLISFVFAQTDQRDYDNELRYQNKAINSLKKEIEQRNDAVIGAKKIEEHRKEVTMQLGNLNEKLDKIHCAC